MSAIKSATAGLKAQEARLDVIGSNLANVNTVGFKGQRAEFGSLVREQLPYGNAEDRATTVGTGAAVIGTTRNSEQGGIRATGRDLDIAIVGPGYLAVRRPDGQVAYTRDGSLNVDAQGRLVNGRGSFLVPQITVPANASRLSIAATGEVSAEVGGKMQILGKIQLAVFPNPSGLVAMGENEFQPSASSGAAAMTVAGSKGAGNLQQGSLEGSNVDLAKEMSQLMDAQRSFGMLARVITSADQMESLTNEMTR